MESTTSSPAGTVFFDAGLFIGALLKGDPRHGEARILVEAARLGQIAVATSPGVLCEVYGALTWEQAQPRHAPAEAAEAVRLLVDAPSAIGVLAVDIKTALRALSLAAQHRLTARRIHDAHHAAAALEANIAHVYTYDPADWRAFEANGLKIIGPPTIVAALPR